MKNLFESVLKRWNQAEGPNPADYQTERDEKKYALAETGTYNTARGILLLFFTEGRKATDKKFGYNSICLKFLGDIHSTTTQQYIYSQTCPETIDAGDQVVADIKRLIESGHRVEIFHNRAINEIKIVLLPDQRV